MGMGMVFYFSGRYGEAVKALEKYLGHAPQNPDALRLLGASLYELGRYDDAEKVIHHYLKLKPTSYWGKAYLGRIAKATNLRSRHPPPR